MYIYQFFFSFIRTHIHTPTRYLTHLVKICHVCSAPKNHVAVRIATGAHDGSKTLLRLGELRERFSIEITQ